MERELKQKIESVGRENVKFDFPMAHYSTIKAGGVVDAFFMADDEDGLKSMLMVLKKERIPYMVIGRCSNVLFTDRGFKGVVICLGKGFSWIKEKSQNSISVGAGLPVNSLIEYCRKKGISGLEFLCGIPASLGGAVYMNAGAYGKEIGDRVIELEIIDSSYMSKRIRRDELKFEYRRALISDNSIITRVFFKIERANPRDVSDRISSYRRERKATQPLNMPSCGSVFKNPPGHYAGRLIEEAGLKGMCVGDAMISPKHANFIVNKGNATAGDIISLIELTKQRVKEKTGIELECEVKILGE